MRIQKKEILLIPLTKFCYLCRDFVLSVTFIDSIMIDQCILCIIFYSFLSHNVLMLHICVCRPFSGSAWAFNLLTTKNYNFLTYVQASFSWLKKRNFQTKTIFPYSFGYDLQESAVKIEFGPVENPIWRQI